MKYWEIVADKSFTLPVGRGVIAAPLRRMAGIGLLTPTKATGNATLSNLMSP